MKITTLTTLLFTSLLISSQTIASPDDDILDEITIRVLVDSENMSINVFKIALPNIAGDHGVEHPGAADNANQRAAEAGENSGENSGGSGGGSGGGKGP
jgi:hypothetical protein